MSARTKGRILWITGLPASGKSTLGEHLIRALEERGVVTLWLDSDDLREVMTPNPTYSFEERDHFYRAVGHVAALSALGGAAVVVSATAPRQSHRDAVRERVPSFVEIYLRCSVETCRSRDVKGLYAKADAGTIKTLPGVGATYETPTRPELALDSATHSPVQLCDMVLRWLDARHLLAPPRASAAER